jgi:hypothetical protein
MMPRRNVTACLRAAALILGALSAMAVSAPAADREPLLREADSLTVLLQPKIVEMNGFRNPRPVLNEATTKAALASLAVPAVREYYGPDGLRKEGRVASALGLLPPGYDLEAGSLALLIELMGGGYDPLRKKIYVLTDLPSNITTDPSVKRMIAAHEITHALQDQQGDMVAQLRRGIFDWDYAYVYNCVIEGMAYVTMMAILSGTSLDQAGDPTLMLEGTRKSMQASPGFKEFAKAPPYLVENLFGRGVQGIAFCREYLQAHPDTELAALLDALPASGEQILHGEKYRENDLPVPIDLSSLASRLPGGLRPYLAGNLGEFHVKVLCESHAATRETAAQIAAGWDGFRFEAFEDDESRLVVLGLSAWDSEPDAVEFAEGFAKVLADVHDPRTVAVERDGRFVRFTIDTGAKEARRASLNALAAIQASTFRPER